MNILTRYLCGDQLLCIRSSFFINPISPPKPATSLENWIRFPLVGNSLASLLSSEQMCLKADFKLGPHCSRTLNDACLEQLTCLNDASY